MGGGRNTLGVVLKTWQPFPCGPTMHLPCCAACLHAITEPERPVRFDGCLFHASHVPAEAGIGSF